MGLARARAICCWSVLAACAGVTLRAVATALGIELRDAAVRARAISIFAAHPCVSKDVPVGFQQIPLHFDLDTHASEEELATLLRLRERCCVIYQTLTHPAKIDVLHRLTSR